MHTPIISVAPMMDWTDRHDRFFLRLISPHVRLYTEMITAQAIQYGDVDKLLSYDPSEHPIALQLGGCDPRLLADATRIANLYHYDEINLNVGCPSPRVSAGRFGACLMLEPELVASCVSAMSQSTEKPVTVKCRIGVDDVDDYSFLSRFIETVANAGCRTFIIHARNAWLNGLSPKQNREIPPLQYDMVKRIKLAFPQLTIILNGGLTTVEQIDEVLTYTDGVMVGRKAYHQPYFLADLEAKFFKNSHILDRRTIVKKMLPYIQDQLYNGVKLSSMTRHILGLFHGEPGAAKWRRYLSEHAHRKGAGIMILEDALALIDN